MIWISFALSAAQVILTILLVVMCFRARQLNRQARQMLERAREQVAKQDAALQAITHAARAGMMRMAAIIVEDDDDDGKNKRGPLH